MRIQNRIIYFIFLAAVFVLYPVAADACHETHILSPVANIHRDLPASIQAEFNVSSEAIYYLYLYSGTPGNAVLVNGHSQGRHSCENHGLTAGEGDTVSESGEYFYVLFNAEQITDFSLWNSHWTTGVSYSVPVFQIDHAVSEFSVNTSFDPVIIIPGILGSSDKNGVWVIDPVFHIYDDLIDTLIANGYTKDVDLFTMPYDWRQSNVLTALELRDRINEIQGICQCPKVDLVAHSMGGLVARQYIQSNNYGDDVDQLIFLGTPHLGAPKSYLMWEGGENDIKREDQLLRLLLSKEAKKAGYSSLFDYVRNKPIPSVQELLPVYNYLKDASSDALRTYPNSYPQNTFLENLKSGAANLLNKGIAITNIVGSVDNVGTEGTLNAIRVVASSYLPLWEHGYPEGFYEKIGDRGLERGLGDGTVPEISSKFIPNDLNQISSEHGVLPTKSKALIFKKLTGHDATTLITTNADSFLDINFKLLIIKVLSPVDVLVTAPDGKRIGKNFNTNSEVNEINNAFYSGFLTDDEYITIPNPLDGEYRVETKGTGTGEYTIATGYISDTESVDRDFTAETQPNMDTTINITVNTSTPSELTVEPLDTTSPTITIISPSQQDYLRSETMPITVGINDKSGVFSSSIRFDDRIVHSGDTIDLFFEKLGDHAVSVSASDFVGNATITTVTFRVGVSIQSMISDAMKASALGWITRKSVTDGLVSKLNDIINQNKPNTLKTFKPFLDDLERNHPKYINDRAYTMLKEEVGWVVSH